MATEMLPSAVGLENLTADDQTRQLILERLQEIAAPIFSSGSAGELRRHINSALMKFAPISLLINQLIIAEALKSGASNEKVTRVINTAAMGHFGEEGMEFLTRADRNVFLRALRANTQIGQIADSAAASNPSAWWAVLLDGYESMLKLNICLSIFLVTLEGRLPPPAPRVAHWLALAAQRHLDEWESVLFSHNPMLQERLSKPLPEHTLISSEAARKRLGL